MTRIMCFYVFIHEKNSMQCNHTYSFMFEHAVTPQRTRQKEKTTLIKEEAIVQMNCRNNKNDDSDQNIKEYFTQVVTLHLMRSDPYTWLMMSIISKYDISVLWRVL